MAVVNMTVGATTPDGARFAVKVDGPGPVRVAVADNPEMTGPVFTSSQALDVNDAAKLEIGGLVADTRYWWRVEDDSVLDTSITGQFLTHPPVGVPGRFTLGIVADAGLSPEVPGIGDVLAPERLSNHPILDTVRERALAEGWLMTHWLGDDSYPDPGSGVWVPDASITTYRRLRDDRLLQPRHHQLDREVAQTRQPDDHDRAQNNHDSTDPGGLVYNQVYREREAHYDLPDADPQGGTYWSKEIRRTLVIGADVRTFKNETPGAMLGAAQLAWMDDLLSSSTAKFLLWLMPGQWMGTSEDSWASHPDEQAAVVDMFAAHGFLGRMSIVGADAHIVALDTGGPNSPGGIPVLQAAPLDASPGFGDPARYNLGGQADRRQYGTVTVDDLGTHLVVTLTGWQDAATEVVSHSFAVVGDPPPSPSSAALLRSLSGTHRPVFEARVVTGHPTGPEPTGTVIPILSGDVTLDGTADVRGSLQMETAGVDRSVSRDSLFPRRVTDLLAPFGREVFARRGVHLGGAGPLWVPLGYYRINTIEQDDAPYGAIRIIGQDRIRGILDNRVLEPRELSASQTVASVFLEAIGEVYPGATVLFDDDSGAATIGRNLVVEESWLPALVEIANGLGKVFYVDGTGVFRIESAPDESQPVWEVKAGRDGVQFKIGRRVTRDGVFNGVVATGEAAGGDISPVRAVAIDNGPNSPTRWGGPFGRVPHFFSSPFLQTDAQADIAAREMLRRGLGTPYRVDFGSAVNPALKPDDPVLAEYADYNREVHVMEQVTIPLTAGPSMTGGTREKTLVVIGSLA